MRKNVKRFLALILAVVMALSLVGVNYAATAKTTTTAATVSHKDNYKINVFTMLGNYSGLQTGWSAKLIKDKFNLTFNIISSNVEGGGDTKFATMMASGNLGDLVYNEKKCYADNGFQHTDCGGKGEI